MIVVVDFGMGNIWSVSSALNFLDAPHLISSEPKVVQEADTLILPGVGSFGKAMKTLDDKGLSETIIEVVTQKQRKILGICLGFQLMAEIGTEDGTTKGLGLFPGTVDHFRTDGINDKKIPHIGFNDITILSSGSLLGGLQENVDFYFDHSYRIIASDLDDALAICDYGVKFVAALQKENIFATQFHPEKSQTNGLKVLSNFLKA